jgi:hypothetical protein
MRIGHVTCMRKVRNIYRTVVGKRVWKKAVDGRTTLKYILKKQIVRMWAGFIRLKLRSSSGLS